MIILLGQSALTVSVRDLWSCGARSGRCGWWWDRNSRYTISRNSDVFQSVVADVESVVDDNRSRIEVACNILVKELRTAKTLVCLFLVHIALRLKAAERTAKSAEAVEHFRNSSDNAVASRSL